MSVIFLKCHMLCKFLLLHYIGVTAHEKYKLGLIYAYLFMFQEVRVRFSGFGAEEDEWINVRKCVRQRSLPCEATECVAVLPGDLILCFQVSSS